MPYQTITRYSGGEGGGEYQIRQFRNDLTPAQMAYLRDVQFLNPLDTRGAWLDPSDYGGIEDRLWDTERFNREYGDAYTRHTVMTPAPGYTPPGTPNFSDAELEAYFGSQPDIAAARQADPNFNLRYWYDTFGAKEVAAGTRKLGPGTQPQPTAPTKTWEQQWMEQQQAQAEAERRAREQAQQAQWEREERLRQEELARQQAAAAEAERRRQEQLGATRTRVLGQKDSYLSQLQGANAWDEDVFNQIASSASSLFAQLGDAADSGSTAAIQDLINQVQGRRTALNNSRNQFETDARNAYGELQKRTDFYTTADIDNIANGYASLFGDIDKYKATQASDEVAQIKAYLDRQRGRITNDANTKKAADDAAAQSVGSVIKQPVLGPTSSGYSAATPGGGGSVTGTGNGTTVSGNAAFGASLGGATAAGASTNNATTQSQRGWQSLF